MQDNSTTGAGLPPLGMAKIMQIVFEHGKGEAGWPGHL
jgi:hypothetical protein